MAETLSPDAAAERWRKILVDGHSPMLMLHRIFRYLPSPPRCKVCHNPFGGIGGKLVGLFGFTRSRKNPSLCANCCDQLPPGGAELDIAVLFADVRGSTAMGQQMEPGAYAAKLNRFYRSATDALIRHDAIIDKLIGDAVMALFIPGICGPDYKRRAVQAAQDLLESLGYGGSDEAWMPIGSAVHSGVAYVGNVGGDVVDFTALGDPVNIAARLASVAAAGEALLSETVYASVHSDHPDLEQRTLALRGREAPVDVRVLHAGAS